MIQEKKAQRFAQQWIQAWNEHDLPAILSHYAEAIQFQSPFIPLLQLNESGVVSGKTELERYFRKGLETYPELHFQLHQVFMGLQSLVLYYTSVNGKLAAEVMELDEEGKAVKVFCHYAPSPTT